MKEKLTRQDVGFAQIKNEVLSDPNLSLKAKGLFAYLYSKPNDWNFSGERIVKESLEGRKAIYSGLKELEENGYLIRSKQPDGRVDYYITYNKEPNVQNGQKAKKPIAQKGKEPKGQTAQTGSISNKELLQTNSLTNKDDKILKKTEKFIKEVKEILKDTNLNQSQVQEIQSFVSYWTEPNKSKTKIKYELQKTWDMKRRIGTWMRNSIKWGSKDNKYKAQMI